VRLSSSHLAENLWSEPCKHGMCLGSCGARWHAGHVWQERTEERAGQDTGRLAEESGCFSQITLRCRACWGETTV